MQSIFISHTHTDEELAHAIRDAVEAMFGDAVAVRYSTNKELGGGIEPGDDWFRWIGEQVRESQVALILLTPSSVQKPWVLWEGGAVAGAAMGGEGAGARKLRPISYKLRGAEIPAPFGRDQITDGLADADAHRLFEDLLQQFSVPQDRLIRAAQKLEGARTAYLTRAREALRISPLLVTEAAVQEWLERIDSLESEARYSETNELHDWLNLAFGRNRHGEERPLDLRIHRRIGELYSRGGNAERAAREFELARQLAPRDIYVLRRLGKAYLDQRRLDDAGAILDLIAELDADAFVRNSENAALKARWHRDKGDLAKAAAVLHAAAEANPTSYYLADLLGQVQLERGHVEEAKSTYRGVLNLLGRIRDRNVWLAASGLTAAVVTGDVPLQVTYLSALAAASVTEEQAESIHRGVSGAVNRSGADLSILNRLAIALKIPDGSK
ncbi:MAG TPA: TIR domain-containing protein [Devosiaceae bacterium]|nr:TIR domain-containing protein [Devosiaceae bacterium]